jgi:hypothetical protein
VDIYDEFQEFEYFFLKATLPGGMMLDDYNKGMIEFVKLQIRYAKHLESLTHNRDKKEND